jgi:hypothetical protein
VPWGINSKDETGRAAEPVAERYLCHVFMRTLYLPVFVISLIIAWAFLGWFGDFNTYVDEGDGRMWVKIKGTTTDHVFQSLFLAFIFASVETGILWLWKKLRG